VFVSQFFIFPRLIKIVAKLLLSFKKKPNTGEWGIYVTGTKSLRLINESIWLFLVTG